MKHVGLALLLVLSMLLAAVPSGLAAPADWDVPGGHFFSQTSEGGKGYAVVDDGEARFWSEFRRLGGVQSVGYPVSRRFSLGGFICQAFQRVVFQWRAESGSVSFLNVFDLLSTMGKDDYLLSVRQVPKPLGPDFDAGLSWEQTLTKRLALLDAFPALKQQYYAVVGDAVQMNGLPTSPVTDMGNNYTVRCQRVVLQLWKEDVPWATKGQVTVGNGGQIAKELGLLPAAAGEPLNSGESAAIVGEGQPPAAPPPPPPPQPVWPGNSGGDPRFGTVQVSEVGDGNARAADLNLSWSRELFYWSSVNGPGDVGSVQYTSRYYQTPLSVVGLIQFTPGYAGGGSGLQPPAGIRLPWNDPGNHFGQFARQLARDMAGRVDNWIVWNEPDICQPGSYGYSWAGTPEDYYYLLKTGYQAIKAGNPRATVIFGSLGIVSADCRTDGTDSTFFNRWLAEARRDNAAAGNWYFDVMSLNIHKEPERIYEMIRLYKSLMAQNGFQKPVWLMETSVPVHSDGSAEGQDFAVGKGDQQSYLIQAYANALAAGAERLSVYKLCFFPPDDPAYRTLKVAFKYKAGANGVSKTPEVTGAKHTGVVRIALDGPGFRTTVVYNRSQAPQRVQVPASAAYAFLADKNGNERVIYPEGGVYTLDLEGATGVYHSQWGEFTFVGGSPLMLREAR